MDERGESVVVNNAAEIYERAQQPLYLPSSSSGWRGHRCVGEGQCMILGIDGKIHTGDLAHRGFPRRNCDWCADAG